MSDTELTAPHHLTVGYVGRPGERTFYLQAEDAQARLSVQLEKGQVDGIGDLLTQLLARIGESPATEVDRGSFELRVPVDAQWRVREVGVGIDDAEAHLLLELAGVTETGEPASARIWFDRGHARRLATHASRIVAEGRPRCRLCDRPTAADGDHVCPSTNGHGPLGR